MIGEDHARSRGAVSVLVQALPAKSEADRARVAAVRLEAEACAAFADVERGADAAAKFAAAAALRERIGDTRGSGIDLLQEADARMVRLNEYARSSELAAKAVELSAAVERARTRDPRDTHRRCCTSRARGNLER